mmetsp:Transcript_16762/g.31710  ORF Transcript_16762/g.31710 Transcript_16762/m.31710 type:complete len:240 (+) Transcript_16762:41-760(+)
MAEALPSSAEELECACCAEALSRDFFSGSQWRKGAGARCKACIRSAKDPPVLTDSRLIAFVEECRAAKEEFQQSQTEVVSSINEWIRLGGALRAPSEAIGETSAMICAALERNVTPVLQEHFPADRRLILGLDDKGSEGLWPAALDRAVDFAREVRKDGPIYVFCALGCNRSAVVVIALLMAIDGLSLDQALQVVRTQRPCVRPKYMRTLAEYELRLGRDCSRPEFLEAPDSKSFGALF